MKNSDEKFIVEGVHPLFFRDRKNELLKLSGEYVKKDLYPESKKWYVKKIGKNLWDIAFTSNIYEAKRFGSRDKANDAVTEINKRLKTCVENGWRSFLYDYVPATPWKRGGYSKVLEHLDMIVHKVKMQILD